MRVVVVRHGKVLHNWKKWCTSAEYDEQCALYDCAAVDTASVGEASHNFPTIYISTLDRTLQTAQKQFVNSIIDRSEDSAIVTHGFFMHTLIKAMKKAGFRADRSRISYRNGETIVLRRDNTSYYSSNRRP